MILVHAPFTSPRLDYVVHVLFTERLGQEVRVTTSVEDVAGHDGPVIAYGTEVPGTIVIPQANDLLERSDITAFDARFREIDGRIGFATEAGIDIFATTFWLLSRYEEHHVEERDEHGRFPARASMLLRDGWLARPIVDEHVAWLRRSLISAVPNIELRAEAFAYHPSIDIDIGYAHAHKGAVRWLGGLARQVVEGRFTDLRDRLRVSAGARDPFDTYDHIIDLFRRVDGAADVFIPCGDPGPFDRHNDVRLPGMKRLVRRLAAHARIGLHPSYSGGQDIDRLRAEKRRLEEVLDAPVFHSRHHYLRIDLPTTYRLLVEVGIEHDHSMAFADAPGYRAGTSRPFQAFDLVRDEALPLTVHPFSVMEHTFDRYMPCSAAEAFAMVRPILEATRAVDGLFVTNAHNHTLVEGSAAWVLMGRVEEGARGQ